MLIKFKIHIRILKYNWLLNNTGLNCINLLIWKKFFSTVNTRVLCDLQFVESTDAGEPWILFSYAARESLTTMQRAGDPNLCPPQPPHIVKAPLWIYPRAFLLFLPPLPLLFPCLCMYFKQNCIIQHRIHF